MRRREFLGVISGAAAVWPLAARSQQPAMPAIGFLGSASPDGYVPLVDGFRRGLSETGYIEGRNVAIEYLWAGGQYDRLPALAADLVRRRVAVIFTAGAGNSAVAAKGCDLDHPNRLCDGKRSGEDRFGRQHESARRERNGRQLHKQRAGAEAY